MPGVPRAIASHSLTGAVAGRRYRAMLTAPARLGAVVVIQVATVGQLQDSVVQTWIGSLFAGERGAECQVGPCNFPGSMARGIPEGGAVRDLRRSARGAGMVRVRAAAGRDGWAVGWYRKGPARAFDTLILHWNGTAWAQVHSPNPSPGNNYLFGVSARSGSDAWAVGNYDSNTLIVHSNGTAWTQVKTPSPDPGVYSPLNEETALSGSDPAPVGAH